MIVHIETHHVRTPEAARDLLSGALPLTFQLRDRKAAYPWMESTLKQLGYENLRKKERGWIKRYLEMVTGLSRAQVTRLVKQFCDTGHVRDGRGVPANAYRRRFIEEDVILLAWVDELHGTLSGPATRKLFERAYFVFGDKRFERLATISSSHIYNLRRSLGYRRRRRVVKKTVPRRIAIGERRKPHPAGKPGYLRIDTVHQGDSDGKKGVYYLNAVDEVTQMEVACCVAGISERFLMPALEYMLDAFPFPIRGFHSDNGSEYVNCPVAELLSKLNIEFTKSRARRTNDNALVESKNGSVIRKCFGHGHIPAEYAEALNAFSTNELEEYINFHKPCWFAEEHQDAKGKIRKRYRYENMMTPYEKLKSLPDAASYLKPGVTFEKLDALARRQNDQEAAERMNKARAALFASLTPSRRSA